MKFILILSLFTASMMFCFGDGGSINDFSPDGAWELIKGQYRIDNQFVKVPSEHGKHIKIFHGEYFSTNWQDIQNDHWYYPGFTSGKYEINDDQYYELYIIHHDGRYVGKEVSFHVEKATKDRFIIYQLDDCEQGRRYKFYEDWKRIGK